MADSKATDTAPQWETAAEAEGEPWQADKPGDALIGTYTAKQVITFDGLGDDGQLHPKSFNKYLIEGEDGRLWGVAGSWKVDKAFENVAVGSVIRLEYVGEVDMGKGRSPMHDYRLQVRRS